jgi:hypothetical protein
LLPSDALFRSLLFRSIPLRSRFEAHFGQDVLVDGQFFFARFEICIGAVN